MTHTLNSPLATGVACALLLGLSACQNPGVDNGTPANEEAPAAEIVLNGVDLTQDLRLLGTEPFWGIDIVGSEILYSGVDRPALHAEAPTPEIQGSTATWNTMASDGRSLQIVLMGTECSDGMSDRTYPLSAQVQLGEERLIGCAAPPNFIYNTDEQSQPHDETVEGPNIDDQPPSADGHAL